MMDETERARRFADELAATLAGVLEERLVAAFLHGSLVQGDVAAGRSDVDVLVVVERPLADEELAAAEQAATRAGAQGPAAVDLRIVTRASAAAPTPSPPLELYVRTTPGREATVVRRAVEPDLLVEFSLVRRDGRRLLGAQPSAVIGPVPAAWALRHGDEHLARWGRLTDDLAHAELMVLTACRIWRLAEEDVHGSKAEAGRWALDQDRSLVAVERVLRLRAGQVVGRRHRRRSPEFSPPRVPPSVERGSSRRPTRASTLPRRPVDNTPGWTPQAC
jgi:hypothetical protein